MRASVATARVGKVYYVRDGQRWGVCKFLKKGGPPISVPIPPNVQEGDWIVVSATGVHRHEFVRALAHA